jgi:hypothetical protein
MTDAVQSLIKKRKVVIVNFEKLKFELLNIDDVGEAPSGPIVLNQTERTILSNI